MTVIINSKDIRKNKVIRKIQKENKKYYGRRSSIKNNIRIKTKIKKFVDVCDIKYLSLINEDNNVKTINNITREEVLNLCKEKEIRTCGGDNSLLYNKLNLYNNKKGILLIKGIECDPGLIHDTWIYRNKMDLINKTIIILKKIYSFEKVFLCTKEPILYSNNDFEIIKLKDRYPMGYEKILIKDVLSIDIDENTYPLDKDILVLNIQTILALGEAIYKEEVNNRYITVSNIEIGKAIVCKAKIGMDIKEIVNECENTIGSLSNEDIYIGRGALNCFKNENNKLDYFINFIGYGYKTKFSTINKYVGCGKCIRNCPININIKQIVSLDEKGASIKKGDYNSSKCIKCGACTYFYNAYKDLRELVNKLN